MATQAEYGSWDSPITPDLFAKCNCKAICEIQVVGKNVYWVEQNAVTGKRELYSKPTEGGEAVRWAKEQSVQTAVHEYGGGALHVLSDGWVLFATIEGLFYQKSPDQGVDQIAEAKNRTFRFADCSTNDTHIFCVHESHAGDAKFPVNQLISIDRATKSQLVVASGADFYAYPRISPNGKKLVWMQWNHINMPWDESSILMADIDSDGSSRNPVVVKDGNGKKINYMGPSWTSDDQLLLVHDATNWWNVYTVDAKTFEEENVYELKRECGYPLWQLGFRSYAYNQQYLALNFDGEIYSRFNNVFNKFKTEGYTVFSHLSIDPNGHDLFMIASGPKRASSLISLDLSNSETSALTVHRESRDSAEIDAFEISVPEEIKFVSDGVEVAGYFYPPLNSSYVAPEGTLPPLLLLGHGGPTAPAQTDFDLKKQFFTSRGIAVFDVNYRGSTGFGSEFRRMLYKTYGVVDRDDMMNGAKALIEEGRVDGNKVLITGSSSGGFLILSCLTSPQNIIKAAVSVYGVADLLALDEDTHKLEQSYNEVLVGKYPEEAHVFEERSPINHIDKINTPIAFLHGKEDTVVPVNQSIEMFEKIRSRGVTTALMLFENEGHGFRSGKTIQESTEATFYFLMKAIGIEPSIKSNIEIVNPK